MKKTALYDWHKENGAKLVPFAGYEMPIQYTSILEEHKTVRDSVGLFDVSHMGEIEIKGEKAVEFAEKVFTNNIRDMKPGEVKYTVMCKEDGGVIDDLFVHFFAPDNIFLVVNASNKDKDYEWIKSHEIDGVTVTDTSDKFTEIAVQGPNAPKVLEKLSDFNAPSLPYFTFTTAKVAGIDSIVARTGYTGEDGYEIYISNDHAVAMWNALMEAGAEFGIKPIGLGARDTLRFEVCYWLYGNELSETINPLEAGQKFVLDFEKDFIGKDALLEYEENGKTRKLVCFKMIDKGGVPRHEHKVFDGDKEIGFITSGGMLPNAGYIGAMAYVPFGGGYKTGKVVQVEIRDKKLNAEIIKKPFYKGTAGQVRQ
ncbi:MAG TPA: glycine cleavage system aminomethyltransferase GcvT [Caldisericia bacterium]|nr:glycine cleavage system aminomethyltransferase GcvT [Caldisericia bacterium]HPF48112.1 glycine cleavage system aminomethyltransferase GcvT [Caldisericia bacterium]HPI83951.1 glycine cleavage system aminomethyltransferase GcvT [Caldisericia bacterium]HPQ92565.1 glycine cleavage system aminomethyltransferase GcvT [Caldisericia bacterium]HRV74337.1 glycine cleavage system aminomethyltransferase GcvT [Caldisericia bacterium]